MRDPLRSDVPVDETRTDGFVARPDFRPNRSEGHQTNGKHPPVEEARTSERSAVPDQQGPPVGIRTYLRRVEEAIASGDVDAAKTALRDAQPELMRGVTKGVMHQNTASRKMSRLSNRVKALG